MTVNWFRIANGVSADDCAANFGRFLITAAQNRRNCLRRNQISGKSHDVQGRERPAPHGKNIGERIGGGDLAVSKWIVHNRREEIDGLHERTMSIQTINAGVIERVRIDEHFRVRGNWKLTQNLRQGLLAQLGSSPRAGGERR